MANCACAVPLFGREAASAQWHHAHRLQPEPCILIRTPSTTTHRHLSFALSRWSRRGPPMIDPYGRKTSTTTQIGSLTDFRADPALGVRARRHLAALSATDLAGRGNACT